MGKPTPKIILLRANVLAPRAVTSALPYHGPCALILYPKALDPMKKGPDNADPFPNNKAVSATISYR